jgi:chemotaxis methyl-accepting protein methylase
VFPLKLQTIFQAPTDSRILQKSRGLYIRLARGIWRHLPPSVQVLSAGRMYSRYLHDVVQRLADRRQSFGTFFLRNRPELQLVCRVLDQKGPGAEVDIAVLACSKGAEVYSIVWAIRSARPDLKLRLHALDISEEILNFAERGVYSLAEAEAAKPKNGEGIAASGDVNWNTSRDQIAPIFERMTPAEVNSMFEVESDEANVKPWLKEGIHWLRGDACDLQLVSTLGLQDIVVANRFLCHMQPAAAEKCLRNIAHLVKPGGYLFVSGIDLDVRAKVAQAMGWKPVTELISKVHDGDTSIRRGWPLEYWGLEPFDDRRSDWQIRYASVFQIGEASCKSDELANLERAVG